MAKKKVTKKKVVKRTPKAKKQKADVGMNPFIPNIKTSKRVIPSTGDIMSDIPMVEVGMTVNTAQVKAPSEYSQKVIGETLQSVFNGIRTTNQHDVVLALPNLIQDIVDDAYRLGRSSVGQ